MSEQTNRIEAELAEDRAKLRETVEELGDRLAPKRVVHEASRAIGWGAGEIATVIAQQVREKPIPTLMTAVGLAWLMLGSRRNGDQSQQSRHGLFDGDTRYPTNDELSASDAWANYQERSWSTIRLADEEDDAFQRRLNESRAEALGVVRRHDEDDASFQDRVAAAADKAQSFAAACKRKLGALARSGKRTVASAAHAAGDALGSAADAAKQGVSKAAHTVKGVAASGVDAGEQAVRRARQGSAEFYDAHPLAAGAIGFAVGAMAGSAMPLTSVERRSLEGLVDQGINRGADGLSGAAKAVGSVARDIRS